jgi:hypothetical protein
MIFTLLGFEWGCMCTIFGYWLGRTKWTDRYEKAYAITWIIVIGFTYLSGCMYQMKYEKMRFIQHQL